MPYDARNHLVGKFGHFFFGAAAAQSASTCMFSSVRRGLLGGLAALLAASTYPSSGVVSIRLPVSVYLVKCAHVFCHTMSS
jgi:hypothetical protein